MFSKLLSGMWPSVSMVAKKCAKFSEAHSAGENTSVFITTGRCER